MSPRKWFACALLLFLVIVVQLVAVDGVALPFGTPDLVTVVVICIGLCSGPLQGMVLGFASGLTVDLLSDHAAGRLALVLCFVGYASGVAADESERSALIPLLVVAVGSGACVLGYALTGLFIGDPRVGDTNIASLLAARVLYDVVLTPLFYPLVRGLLRKLEPARL